jgi:cell wall assembly regulator SMI1
MKTWHKVIAVLATVLLLFTALGIWGVLKLKSFLYPVAPPMPAIISEPMPEILTHLEAVLKTSAPLVSAKLQPGISAEQIAKLEAQYHVQIPDEIKAIYEWHNGSVRAATTNDLADFMPLYRFLPLDEALAQRTTTTPPGDAPFVGRVAYRVFAGHRDSWICLFEDGAGNGYWFDPKRKATEGAVFYNFTEEADFLFFPSPKNMMAGIAECYEQGAFHMKTNSSPPQLDEDFETAQKIWTRFGTGR